MKLFGSKKKDGAPREKAPAQPKPKARSGGMGKGRIALIVVLAVAALLLGGAAGGMVYVASLDTVFPNVTVDGVDLGGRTYAEAAWELTESGAADDAARCVRVALPADCVLSLTTADVCTVSGAEALTQLAFSACKSGSAVENALTYLKCSARGMALEGKDAFVPDETAIRAAVENAAAEVRETLLVNEMQIGENSIRLVKGAQSVAIDAEALTEMIAAAFRSGNYTTLRYDAEITPDSALDIDGLYSKVFAERADAYFDAETKALVPEVKGVSFDKASAAALWEAADYGEEVVIPLQFDEPEVTAALLEETLFRDQLSSMSTSLRGSSANRVNNVALACARIDGIILMPGEQFDYNAALGKRTAEAGFLPAGAYTAAGTVQEYGGGICQVSSTLYYCALYANLQIVDRTCHMYPVAYLPAGLDATVSWGGPEFRFINDREYPIRIDAHVDEETNTAVVELWGTDTDGSYVEMNYSTWYFFDEEYPEVKLGYKAQTYRSVFAADGTLLSRKSEALSTYKYHEEDIEWPEEKLHPPEEGEEPTPEPTDEPTESPTESPTPTPEETPTPTPTPDDPGAPEQETSPEP